MKTDTTKPAGDVADQTLFDDWFDPVETGLRSKLRGFIETMIEEELDTALSRARYGRRRKLTAADNAAAIGLLYKHSSDRIWLVMLHRTRDLLIRQRSSLISAIRAHFAEFGIVVGARNPFYCSSRVMARDPRFALSQELEAKQTLLDQLRALTADDPDFFIDVIEGETNLLELIAALDASIVDDEILVDGAKTALDKLQNRKRTAEARIELKRRLLAHTLQQIDLKTLRAPTATLTLAEARLIVRVRIVISKGYTRRFKRSRFSRAFFSSRSVAHLTMMANRKKNETIKKIGLVTSSSSK